MPGARTSRRARIVVGVFEPRHLTDAAKALDRAAKGRITSIRAGATWKESCVNAAAARHCRLAAERILLVGLERPRTSARRHIVRRCAQPCAR